MRGGKAFEKFTINEIHKSETVKQAKLASRKPVDDPLLQKVFGIVEAHAEGLGDERVADAEREAKALVKRLRDGHDPLGALRPPPDCGPCVRGTHKNHKFFCLNCRHLQCVRHLPGIQKLCASSHAFALMDAPKCSSCRPMSCCCRLAHQSLTAACRVQCRCCCPG